MSPGLYLKEIRFDKFHNSKYEEIIRQSETPILAKLRTQDLIKLQPLQNWNDKKEDIMLRGLEAKFSQHPDLTEILVSTRNKTLIERTDLDDYWGDGKDGKGQNRLGFLLMKIRELKLIQFNN